jgi:hypothetical protein
MWVTLKIPKKDQNTYPYWDISDTFQEQRLFPDELEGKNIENINEKIRMIFITEFSLCIQVLDNSKKTN